MLGPSSCRSSICGLLMLFLWEHAIGTLWSPQSLSFWKCTRSSQSPGRHLLLQEHASQACPRLPCLWRWMLTVLLDRPLCDRSCKLFFWNSFRGSWHPWRCNTARANAYKMTSALTLDCRPEMSMVPWHTLCGHQTNMSPHLQILEISMGRGYHYTLYGTRAPHYKVEPFCCRCVQYMPCASIWHSCFKTEVSPLDCGYNWFTKLCPLGVWGHSIHLGH